MSLFEKIKNKKEKIAVVGLGYVGLPIAVAFAKKGLNVIGFDINKEKINNYKLGIDSTKEIGNKKPDGAYLFSVPMGDDSPRKYLF